jgi:hypothetical protein
MPAALEVEVTADVDGYGTLVVDQQVPVDFQKMHCRVAIRDASGTDSKLFMTHGLDGRPAVEVDFSDCACTFGEPFGKEDYRLPEAGQYVP